MKTILLKSWALLLLMMVSMGAWAESKTITPTAVSGEVVEGKISFTTAKNGGTNAPQFSSGAIRLYQNTSANVNTGARGGSITFTAATGYIIKKVTIANQNNTDCNGGTVAYQVNETGGWAGSKTVAKGTNYSTADNLGASSVEIACFGTTNKMRLYITSITVEYASSGAPVQVLEKVTVSGTPSKKIYKAGDNFDPTGLVVTGTYSDNSTKAITSGITWSEPAALTVGQTSVNITATVDGITSDVFTVNDLTVNERTVIPGTYSIALNKSLYGVETGSNDNEQSTESDDITIVSGCISSASSKTYYDAAHIRYYVGSYLKLSVPAGFVITKVQFMEPSSDKKWDATATGGVSVNEGVYTHTSKSWTGIANKVEFSFSKQCRIGSITVTYAATLTFSATDGTDYYATFSSDKAVKFDEATSVFAVSVSGGALSLNEITSKEVPANTGVLLKNAGTTATYSYVASAAAVEGNMLQPASKDKAELTNHKFYMLGYKDSTKDSETLGFYWGAAEGAAFTSRTGSAYLAIPSDCAGVRGFSLRDMDATGIEAISEATGNKQQATTFNLQGQRVNANTKGIVIVNGKKVFNK